MTVRHPEHRVADGPTASATCMGRTTSHATGTNSRTCAFVHGRGPSASALIPSIATPANVPSTLLVHAPSVEV